MCSTINAHRLVAVLRFCGAAGGIFGVWMVLAALAALAEPTDRVTAFGPQANLMQAIGASDVRILNAGRGFVIVQGRTAGFVTRLYRAGAWVVFPGGLGACGASDPSARNQSRTDRMGARRNTRLWQSHTTPT